MTEIVDQMVTGLTSATLFSEVAKVMPIVIPLMIFGFGYRILKKNVKSGQKGKGSL